MTIDVAAVLLSAWVGQTCRVTRREFDWYFAIGTDQGVLVSVPWRLVCAEGIVASRDDDGQKFGLPEPVCTEARVNDLAAGARVEKVTADPVTADLNILLSNGLTIEIFNNSVGYEGWQAIAQDQSVIAMGGGGFSLL